MADASSLATIASIISTFGIAMLLFRIQRELAMRKAGEINWIPWADWLLIGATLVSFFLVILPMLLLKDGSSQWALLPPAAAAAACTLVAGYIPAILAHYRFIFSGNRTGDRANPEPSERVVARLAAIAAFIIGILTFVVRSVR